MHLHVCNNAIGLHFSVSTSTVVYLIDVFFYLYTFLYYTAVVKISVYVYNAKINIYKKIIKINLQLFHMLSIYRIVAAQCNQIHWSQFPFSIIFIHTACGVNMRVIVVILWYHNAVQLLANVVVHISNTMRSHNKLSPLFYFIAVFPDSRYPRGYVD